MPCRAGTLTRYSWGDDPPTPERANFGMNVGGTTKVGAYPPNPWGLYDMHGNVWEWVEDCWKPRHSAVPDCALRVLRGGSWYNPPEVLRSACRFVLATDFRNNVIGFRVARMLTP